MSKKSSNDLLTPHFSITIDKVSTLHGVQVQTVTVKDVYSRRRYALERALFLAFTNSLQRYLAKRPQVQFSDRRNIARTLTYLPAGVKAWSAYMPGAFATYPVHNPETKTLVHGQKLDPVTRRLFRHSVDAIGLRNRAHILAWAAQQQHVTSKQKVWLSIAAGSGQHVYDSLALLGRAGDYTVYITDIDALVLEFAKEICKIERPPARRVSFHVLDALSSSQLARQLAVARPTIIDMMGLVEYLQPEQIVRLVRTLYKALDDGGMIVFTNMSTTHPHIDLHQRGLGWPGVNVRTIKELVAMIEKAGVPLRHVTVFKSQDKVYNVFVIRKGLVTS